MGVEQKSTRAGALFAPFSNFAYTNWWQLLFAVAFQRKDALPFDIILTPEKASQTRVLLEIYKPVSFRLLWFRTINGISWLYARDA